MTTYPLPPVELAIRADIEILHPGYEANPRLLLLPRVDPITTATGPSFGIHYGTVLIACQIIANNAFKDGHLTLDREGLQVVNLEFDDILTEDIYYFRIKDGPEKYAIVPSFQDWQFPHDDIPASWPEVSIPRQSFSRCGISNFEFAIDSIHLVPKSETLWFQMNNMGKYARSIVKDINTPINVLSLKADLHRCFDDRWFAITPKIIGTMSDPRYMTHVLSSEADEIWPAYHNTVVQYLAPGSRAYLFARFAWAVLLHVKGFVNSKHPRYVIRVQVSNEGKVEYKTLLANGSQLQDWYGGGGSKSATPKRKRGVTESDADNEGSVMDDDWGDSISRWQQSSGKEMSVLMSSETNVEGKDQAHQLAELKTQLEEVLPAHEDYVSEEKGY